MRARHRVRTRRTNGNGGGNRSNTETSNQLSFNVICLAIALGGDSWTEPCDSEFED
jgi:hypothetical protein